jgi:hypothetical protein
MQTCKTCQSWKKESDNSGNGQCEYMVNDNQADPAGGTVVLEVPLSYVWFTSGPEFGCVRHQPVKSEEQNDTERP